MKCEDIHNRLSQYIDDQLDKAAVAEIEKHLEECDECRQYYKRLQSLAGMADQFDLTADEAYWESRKNSVLEKIEKSEKSNIEVVKPKRSHDIWYRFSAVAAVIALVAFISVYESMDVEETRDLFKKQDTPELKEIRSNRSATPIKTELDKLQDISATESAEMKIEESDDSGLEPMAEKPAPAKVSLRGARSEEVDLDNRVDQQKGVIISNEDTDIDLETVSDKLVDHPDSEDLAGDAMVADESVIKSIDRVQEKGTNGRSIRKLGDQAQYRTEITMSAPSTPEPVEAGEKNEYVEALWAEPEPESGPEPPAPETEDRIMLAFDVENPAVGMAGTELDPDMFADFSDEDKMHYISLKQRVENLNHQYGFLLSTHEEEITAKRKSALNDDSIGVVTAEMADAYHELGMLTPDETEQSNILSWLNKLLKIVDKKLLQKIKGFISNIENKSP